MPANNGSELGTLLSGLLQNKNLKRKFESYADRLIKKNTKYRFARYVTPSDIVASLILKLLNGNMHWYNPEYSFTSFFYNRIKTEIFNLVKKERKFIPVPLPKSEAVDEFNNEIEDDIPQPDQFLVNPFEDLINREEYDPLVFKQIAFTLLQELPEEFLVLEGIYNGLQTKKICLDLGLTKAQVHNIKRRIKRIVISWINRNKKKNSPLYKQLLINSGEPLTNTSDINIPGKPNPENKNKGELI